MDGLPLGPVRACLEISVRGMSDFCDADQGPCMMSIKPHIGNAHRTFCIHAKKYVQLRLKKCKTDDLTAFGANPTCERKHFLWSMNREIQRPGQPPTRSR
jgi:hypothetical protein